MSRVAAHEEGRKGALIADMPEDLCIGLEDEVLEMGWGNLGYDRVHRYDDVHAFFQIEVGHLQPQFRGVGHQLLDILGVLARIAEKVRSPQVGSQRIRTAEEPVQSGSVAHGLFDAPRDIQYQRDSSGISSDLDIGNFKSRFQGMRADAGRAVLFPFDGAAQNFRFQLQVKQEDQAIRRIHLFHFQQRLDELVRVLIDFIGSVSLQKPGMDPSHGNPGGTFRFFMPKRFKKHFFASHARLLC